MANNRDHNEKLDQSKRGFATEVKILWFHDERVAALFHARSCFKYSHFLRFFKQGELTETRISCLNGSLIVEGRRRFAIERGWVRRQ